MDRLPAAKGGLPYQGEMLVRVVPEKALTRDQGGVGEWRRGSLGGKLGLQSTIGYCTVPQRNTWYVDRRHIFQDIPGLGQIARVGVTVEVHINRRESSARKCTRIYGINSSAVSFRGEVRGGGVYSCHGVITNMGSGVGTVMQ